MTSHRSRRVCAVCGAPTKHILDLGMSPLANNYRTNPDQAETYYPLGLMICTDAKCEVTQTVADVDDEDIYGREYGFYSGGSPAQMEYHRAGSHLLLDRYPELLTGRRTVIEVGSNDGSLLSYFKAAGCQVLGVDPAAGPAETARARGIPTLHEPLSPATAELIRSERGPVGLVIAYQCMAHIKDVAEALSAIRALMDGDSRAVIEVQYLPDLVAGNMYDQVYHEHRYFWSLDTFTKVAARRGLFVVDAELIELQGGGIRFTLATDEHDPTDRMVQIELNESLWLDWGLTALQGAVDRTIDHLGQLIENELEAGRTVAGYGASAKACTIVNAGDLGDALQYIVDLTPHKQGKYLPGTKIPIVSQEYADAHPVDTLVMLTVNYLGRVLRTNPHPGRWITPLPLPAVM